MFVYNLLWDSLMCNGMMIVFVNRSMDEPSGKANIGPMSGRYWADIGNRLEVGRRLEHHRLAIGSALASRCLAGDWQPVGMPMYGRGLIWHADRLPSFCQVLGQLTTDSSCQVLAAKSRVTVRHCITQGIDWAVHVQ